MRRLAIKYSIFDIDTGEFLIQDFKQGVSNRSLVDSIQYSDTDTPDALVYDNFFNIKVTTLEEKNAIRNTNTR